MALDKVYIFEKPDAARHFVKALGWNNPQKNKHYIQQGTIAVTWAYGHLISQAPPQFYCPELKSWDLNLLPIIPKEWNMIVSERPEDEYKKNQLFAIRDLLKKSTSVVIATDADREGETIGWEIIEFFNYSGKKYRMMYSELTPKVLIHANNNLYDAAKYWNLYQSGLGRMRADWILGMNLTMGYTSRNQGKLPPKTVINSGRVISPIIYLITEREKERTNFIPEDYFNFKATFNKNKDYTSDIIFDKEILDGNLLKNKEVADKIYKELQEEKNAKVKSHETKKENTGHPSGFALSDLQKIASKKFNYSPKETLEIAQALYEKHQLISYPRTDCSFLGDSQFSAVPSIIEAVYSNIGSYSPDYGNVKNDINTKQKTKIWNTSKVSAHHAIIPTEQYKSKNELNQNEINIYDIICRRYIAQFLPLHQYDQTLIITETNTYKYHFRNSGKVILVNGWKDIEVGEAEEKEDSLPLLSVNDEVKVVNINKVIKKTEPPKLYTYETLISDMLNIDKFIKNEKLRKIIKGRGIGTEATRAEHIQGVFDKGFAKLEKKNIRATDKAMQVVEIMPDENKLPEVSAYWEEELDLIEKGESTLEKFLEKQEKIITRLMNKIKNGECDLKENIKGEGKTYSCDKCGSLVSRFKSKKGNIFWRCQNRECSTLYEDNRGKKGDIIEMNNQPEGHFPCPTCGKNMLRRKNRTSGEFFWVCEDDTCKTFCKDNNGTLGDKVEPKKKQTSEHDCDKCKTGKMIARNGKNGVFWSCNNYPKCENAMPDKDGKPDYEAKKNSKPTSEHKCPNCDKGYLVKRNGQKGAFWGCNNYPKCKTIKEDDNGKPKEG